MNITASLNLLHTQGIFIHTAHEQYKDGTNLCFSIEFSKEKNQTMWFNDDHEHGDSGSAFEVAVKFAEFLAKDDKLRELYFFGNHNTSTPEGLEKWIACGKARTDAHNFIDSLTK